MLTNRAGNAAGVVVAVAIAGWSLYACVADAADRSIANCEEAARKKASGEQPATDVLDQEWCRGHLAEESDTTERTTEPTETTERTSTTEAVTTTTTDDVTPSSTDYPSFNEVDPAVIESIQGTLAAADEGFGNAPAQLVWELAVSTCEQLDDGEAIPAMVVDMGRTGMDGEDAAAVLIASTFDVCPQHKNAVADWAGIPEGARVP
jgi:hypothetical protein